MKRFISIILSIALLITVFVQSGVMAVESKPKQVLRVGINAEYPPFEYFKDKKREVYAGFDIDMMIFVGIELGCDVEFVDMEFDALFRAVDEGAVDCAISTITYTKERDAVLDFTDEYLTAKVQYAEEEEAVESYHVVFTEGAAIEKGSLYHQVNDTLNELKNMGVVDTLIKKHKLTASDSKEYDVILNINEDGTVDLPEEENVTIILEEPKYTVTPWAENHVKRAQSMDWVRGGDFTTKITRGEFCSVVNRFLESSGLRVDFYAMETPFTDIGEGFGVENGAIKYLYCLDIVKGKSETLFCPDDYLTREEAAVIFTRIMDAFRKWKIADIKADAIADWAYTDNENISHWANAAVYTVSNLGIMQGTDNGFEPKSNLTYEQAVVMLLRLYDIRWGTSPSEFSDKMNSLMPKNKNYMFSPLSIKMTLSLAANGADDETQDEICTLFDEEDVAWYNEEVKGMLEKYSESELLCANIANSVWVNKSKTDADFAEEFKKNAVEFYGAKLGAVDEANAVESVNNWVSEKTNRKIDSILPEDYNDFYSAIVNAIYFNGKWENKFDTDDTKFGMFTNADGSKNEIMFMNQTDYFNYYSDGVTRIVEMPYETYFEDSDAEDEIYLDLNIGMYLVMSDEDINVAEKIWYVAEGADMSSRRVKLSIPKFKVEYSDSFKDELMDLGLKKTFSSEFGNILENESLFVDDILHKTYIRIDEEGTEATAATAVLLLGMGMPEKPAEFIADKPFYFVIRDNDNGEILFMGRYAYAE